MTNTPPHSELIKHVWRGSFVQRELGLPQLPLIHFLTLTCTQCQHDFCEQLPLPLPLPLTLTLMM